MGASFRNSAELLALAGCDRLTISPGLLKELQSTEGTLPRRLQYTGAIKPRPASMSEAEFRWEMNQDVMAMEKLADGILGFTVDQIKLEKMLADKL
jgi:transaldolase